MEVNKVNQGGAVATRSKHWHWMCDDVSHGSKHTAYEAANSSSFRD